MELDDASIPRSKAICLRPVHPLFTSSCNDSSFYFTDIKLVEIAGPSELESGVNRHFTGVGRPFFLDREPNWSRLEKAGRKCMSRFITLFDWSFNFHEMFWFTLDGTR